LNGLVSAAVTADVSGDESSGSNYGTVSDTIVMCPVPSDSSDSELNADDANRQLVSDSVTETLHKTTLVHSCHYMSSSSAAAAAAAASSVITVCVLL